VNDVEHIASVPPKSIKPRNNKFVALSQEPDNRRELASALSTAGARAGCAYGWYGDKPLQLLIFRAREPSAPGILATL
jgi:hypothetical protein